MIKKNVPLAEVEINIDEQKLYFYPNFPDTSVVKKILVSTSKNGVGEKNNSFQTPRGLMQIRAKIGDDAHPLAVFRARRNTNQVCTKEVYSQSPAGTDWILGRVLWLSGLETHFNRDGNVDTMRRFIYIHGTPEQVDINTPGSIGCIRMRCDDLIDFYQQVKPHTKIFIREGSKAKFDIIAGNQSSLNNSDKLIKIIRSTRSIRKTVFENEQKIHPQYIFDEHDEKLNSTIHLLAINRQDIALGSARLVVLDKQIKLGRMAVLPEYRASNVGKALLNKAFIISENLKSQSGINKIVLDSQKTAVGFYKKNGFELCNDSFMEAGVEHYKMHKFT